MSAEKRVTENIIKKDLTYNTKDAKMKRFREYLVQDEMSKGTIEEYMRNVARYYEWTGNNGHELLRTGEEETKRSMLKYKKSLQDEKLAATTINAKLAALNKYLEFSKMTFRMKYLKVQRKIFKEAKRELSKSEFNLLITTAQKADKERIALVMETIGSTGIRVSELKYITLEALDKPAIEIYMKSKVRTIIVPDKMKKKLRKYACKNNIQRGEIFTTATGKSLSRNQIWREMKAVSNLAQVKGSKVYPHNIRALFARLYYEKNKDVIRLSDILGHSSIDTTRIYLKVSVNECQRQIDRMNIIA